MPRQQVVRSHSPHGFRRLVPSALTITGIIVSLYLLSVVARTLPIGTAYAVWVGIGTTGAVIFRMTLLGEPATSARIFLLVLLMVSIVRLKLTAPAMPESPTESAANS